MPRPLWQLKKGIKMDIKEFSDLMIDYGKEINIVFTEEQLQKFYQYMNLLIEWNEKINLTAIIEPKEIILKHFIDSLTIMKYIEQDKSVIDIGTGAGFPGIPIKIVRPDLKVTLLDSLNKRINFLNEVIKQLELENINAVHARIEEYAKNKQYREKYEVATSRAVANLTTLSEYMLPMVKIKGMAICMKGSEVSEEISKSKNSIKILGGKITKIEEFTLPKSEYKRNLILIEKTNQTPGKYPRKPGIPSKEPLY